MKNTENETLKMVDFNILDFVLPNSPLETLFEDEEEFEVTDDVLKRLGVKVSLSTLKLVLKGSYLVTDKEETEDLLNGFNRMALDPIHLYNSFRVFLTEEEASTLEVNPPDFLTLKVSDISEETREVVLNPKFDNPLVFEKLDHDYPKFPNLNLLRDRLRLELQLDLRHCQVAAEIGDLKALTFLFENRCPCDKRVAVVAAENGHLDCLKYLHENGCLLNKYSCSDATRNGNLDCLKYLHDNGCPWDWGQCFILSKDHPECRKYLEENCNSWGENACYWAAENGHLDCLKHLHENGCPWDEKVSSVAARKGHLDCLKYLYKNGCPCDWDICFASSFRYSPMRKYLENKR